MITRKKSGTHKLVYFSLFTACSIYISKTEAKGQFSRSSLFDEDFNEVTNSHEDLVDEIFGERRYRREADYGAAPELGPTQDPNSGDYAYEDLQTAIDLDMAEIQDLRVPSSGSSDAATGDATPEDEGAAYATDEEALDDMLEGNDPMLESLLVQLNTMEKMRVQYDEDIAKLEKETEEAVANGSNVQAGRRLGMNFGEEMDAQAGNFKKVKDMKAAADALAASTQTLKRFTELKQLVSWLQPKDKRISRYCFYGCWCLPEGAHSFVAGEGRPVDESDKACQQLWFCYTCAKQEFKGVFDGRLKECKPDKARYNFKLRYQKGKKNDYTQRDIICRDKFRATMDTREVQKRNCARAVCECDRGLAKKLYRSWTTWDKSRHRIWSQKVLSCKQLSDCDLLPSGAEKTACKKRGCLFIVKHRCLSGGDGGNLKDHNQVCCGLYENDGGRVPHRDQGGTRACCGYDEGTGYRHRIPWYGDWFNTITHCCKNGRVLSAGGGGCS